MRKVYGPVKGWEKGQKRHGMDERKG